MANHIGVSIDAIRQAEIVAGNSRCCALFSFAMRDPEDDDAAREALEEWLRDRPTAAIVVAAVDRLPDDTLEIGMKLSRLTGYHLIGLAQALLKEAIAAAQAAGNVLDPEFEKLRQAVVLLDSESEPAALN